MTVEEAKQIAMQINVMLHAANVSFILAIEADEGEPGGAWHANGNPSAIANMITSVMHGVTESHPATDCPDCNGRLDAMRAALQVVAPGRATARTCH